MTVAITEPNDRDCVVAHHEAGHAFVAYVMRHLTGEVVCCTIQRDDMYEGACTLLGTQQIALRERPADWSDEAWQAAISLDGFKICIYLAGYMAEAIYKDKSVAPGQSVDAKGTQDRVATEDVQSGLHDEDSQQLPHDLREARKILGYIAKESEWENRLQELNLQTALLLLYGWPAVKSIAAALIEKRTLSGEEVGTIVENAERDEKYLSLSSASCGNVNFPCKTSASLR